MDNERIDESLGFMVNRLATAMKWAFEKRLEEYGLTAPQCGFLLRLFEEDGQPLSNIGRSVYCDKPTITGIANRLEKKGFIHKIRDEKDRRIVNALLTEKGRRLMDVLRSTALDVNTETVRGFSEDEIKELKMKLKASLNNVLGTIEGGVINV